MIHFIFWKCEKERLEGLLHTLSSRFPTDSFSLSFAENIPQICTSASSDIDSMIQWIRTSDVSASFVAVSSGETLSLLPQSLLVHSFLKAGFTVSTAESCTAGMISSAIADISGSSGVLMGGIVSYANEVKMQLLNVSSETLSSVGAVSSETAQQMAIGAQKKMHTTYAVSTTGIAGPTGGNPEKPVGTVWFGFASSRGCFTVCKHFESSLTRGEIRRKATIFALLSLFGEMLRETGESPCDFFISLL